MTHTPSLDAAPGRRPFPVLDPVDLDLLAQAARSRKREHPRALVAVDYEDPGDPQAFGAVFAVQHVAGEPWLVRGVLRSADPRPPVLSRVSVEHFWDPGREVTGAIVRELRFGAIRNRALVRLRERAWNLAHISAVPPAMAASAREAAEKAAAGIPVGPRGAYPEDHYRRIAVRYLQLVQEGRRDVLKALCEEESKRLGEPIGRERMRDWVRKATRRGLLAPGHPGSAGRLPGPNLNPKEEER